MSTLFKKIAVVGDVIADEYFFGESERLSPEYPIPVIKNIRSELRCGGAANVASCLSELTSKVDLYFTISNDIYSKKITKILNSKKIKIFNNLDKNNNTTLKKRIYVEKNLITRLDYDCSIPKNKSDSIFKYLMKNINNYSSIIISDYGKGQINDEISKLIKLSQKKDINVIVDPFGLDWQKYSGAFCLTPNKKEFENIVGKITSKKSLIEKSYALIKKLKIKSLLLTLGSEGMFLMNDKKKYFSFNAIKKQVFDVTGAGDTVCAIFTYFLSRGFSVEDSALYSNQFASLSVTKLGTSPISIKEYCQNFRFNKKILQLDELKQISKFYKSLNLCSVFTNGGFDIIHAGHIDYLERSKRLGQILIVAINSDKSISKLKGKDRPLNKLNYRLKILNSFSFIDHIIVFDELTPIKIIKNINPNIITKGNGYTKNKVVGYDYLQKIGGQVKIINSKINKSSSKLLKLIG